jgi:hypothetical protein
MSLPPAVLSDKLTVKTVADGQFAITVVLSADLVREYCQLLESLAAFFYQVNRKSITASAEHQATSRTLDLQAERYATEYRCRLVTSYDAYRSSGLTRNEAIKQIAADLRSESHPWRSADLVRVTLIAAGRGGRRGRPASHRGQP